MRACLLAAFLLPTAALACDDLVRDAAQEAALAGGLSSSTLRRVVESCGPSGPAAVVHALVAQGACDTAAQLGRSFGDRPGVVAATDAADACLGAGLRGQLGTLDALAGEAEARPKAERAASEPRAPWGGRADDARGGGGAPTPTAPVGAESRGAGRSAPADRGAWSEPDADSAGGRGRRAQAGYASTGAGSLVPSSVGARMTPGSQAAWTQLSLGVWFDVDSATLRSEAWQTVATLATHLRDLDRGTTLEVVGHTDATGSWWYNADLSSRRARAVQQALVLSGVPADRLVIRGAGEDEPVADNASAWGRAQNRRVEFRFWKPVAGRTVTR